MKIIPNSSLLPLNPSVNVLCGVDIILVVDQESYHYFHKSLDFICTRQYCRWKPEILLTSHFHVFHTAEFVFGVWRGGELRIEKADISSVITCGLLYMFNILASEILIFLRGVIFFIHFQLFCSYKESAGWLYENEWMFPNLAKDEEKIRNSWNVLQNVIGNLVKANMQQQRKLIIRIR